MKYVLIFFISISLSEISYAEDVKGTENFKKNFYWVDLTHYGNLYLDFNSSRIKDKIHYVNLVLNYRNPTAIAELSKKYNLKNKGFEGNALSEFAILKINCETYEIKNYKNVYYDKFQEGKMFSMKGNILLSLDNIEEEWIKLQSDNPFSIIPDKYCKSYQSKKLKSLVSMENNQITINNKKQLFEYLVENKLYLKRIQTFDDLVDFEWKKVETDQAVSIFNFKKLTNPSNTKFLATIMGNSYFWEPLGKNTFSLKEYNYKGSPWIYEIDFKNNLVQNICESGRTCSRYEIIVLEDEKIIAEKEFEKAILEATKKRERIIDNQTNNNKTNSGYTGFDIIYYTSLGISKNGIWGIECFYENKPSRKLKAPSSSGPLPICPK